MSDFDAPVTRPGYCPVCSEHANIWAEGKWHCVFCNWEGTLPVYQISKAAKQRLEDSK